MSRRVRRCFWFIGPLAVLTWANWEGLEMHHFVRPAVTSVWQLALLESPVAAHALEARLATEPGSLRREHPHWPRGVCVPSRRGRPQRTLPSGEPQRSPRSERAIRPLFASAQCPPAMGFLKTNSASRLTCGGSSSRFNGLLSRLCPGKYHT